MTEETKPNNLDNPPEQMLHVGVCGQDAKPNQKAVKKGTIICALKDHGAFIVYIPTDKERKRMFRKLPAIMGRKFRDIPSGSDVRAVVGTTPRGTPITVKQVEIVWNDKILIDSLLGPNAYKNYCTVDSLASGDSLMLWRREVLDVAEQLYVE